jgi:serine/threonine protein kinase
LEAVSFLHKLNIVHFDLKPENVVSFVSSGGPSRWKLIDFDSSHALNPSSSSTAVLSCESLSSSAVRLTKEYAAPEVMRMIDHWMTHTTVSDPAPITPPPLAIDGSVDIWSLGMLGFFLFADRPFWRSSSLVQGSLMSSSSLRQEDINSVLSELKLIEHKERSFLQSCLQLDPQKRWNASQLLKEKSLFSTKTPTVAAQALKDSKEELRQVVADLWAARAQPSSSSSSLSSEDRMALQFEEFGQFLEQLLTLNFSEVKDILNSQPLASAGNSVK